MRFALDLAASAKGSTSPNPMVGAVVVRDHQIVGFGAHLKAGEAHAEVHALNMAGEKAIGATLYVTLEPCSHQGRTPPCADLVIKSGVVKVVIATLDPNPLVSGGGLHMLKEAGLQVEIGDLQEEAEALNDVFNHFISTRQPFVTLKTATTLDGKIATVTGESQWITGEEARADVHQLRHEHDAILVGIGTVLDDDPRLTTRLADDEGSHPIRIVLDSTLRTPVDANICNTEQAPTWIFTTQQADAGHIKHLQERGVRIIQVDDKDQVPILHVLNYLGERQVSSLLIEGGGEINASFLAGRFVQKFITYLAPTLIGGDQAPGSFRGKGFHKLTDALRLENVQYSQLGLDLKIVGFPRNK